MKNMFQQASGHLSVALQFPCLPSSVVILRRQILTPMCLFQRRAVAPHTSIDSLKQAAVRKQTKIFLFTFKLTCLFVGCSLPYKAFMLFHALGADVPRSLFNLLGFIRSLYHIIDGWTFCLNAELYETMRLMLGCGG